MMLNFELSSCSKDDNVGNRDVEVPSIYILNPTSEDVYVTTDNSILISGTAQDNNALKSITYSSNGGVSGIAKGLEEWSISNLQLVEGDNKIEVIATDDSNNKNTASITITKNQYLTFLGVPFVDNDVIYTNENTELWITVSIAPNDNLVNSSVRLIEIDSNNNEIDEICTMYDDGNLEHGDEIKGDNVFSAKHIFNIKTEGVHKYRVSAKTLEPQGEVEGTSAVFVLTVLNQLQAEKEIRSLMETQIQIEDILSGRTSDDALSTENKEKKIIEWLQKNPAVKNVQLEESVIKVTHKSGLESYIMKENLNFRGDSRSDNNGRYKTPSIPLVQQTKGIIENPIPQNRMLTRTNITDNSIIQNKNVLIWAPFENDYDNTVIEGMDPLPFYNSPVDFNVTKISNSKCTTASLQNISNYGIVVFDTHGAGGKLILTREKTGWFSDLTSTGTEENYIKEHISGLYCLVTMYNKTSSVTYYAITPKFIKNKIKGKFPNSIIFNASCESMKTDLLANAFISKGVKTYLGFTNSVSNEACYYKEQEFFSSLVGDELKTTGQSYVSDLYFTDYDRYNSFLMRGSKDMHFYLGLLNGDFEYGNLNGWNVSGDGRIITRLGTQRPTQGYYMGIVSTGLGYTENYGSISQTFRVTNENMLSVRWNFFSEEFLEFVGSQFQDYLKITIKDGNKSEVLFANAIDNFANQYSLLKVSPGIVFDKGDVYMTGWQTSTFNISKYKGKTITLIIESGDIGDSIYDSATLLDEIKLY